MAKYVTPSIFSHFLTSIKVVCCIDNYFFMSRPK